jgi:hypothetical protein
MTVAHKNLTGTDLHEVKGASSAAVGEVPVSDGAGGAPFAKLTHTSLETTGNPFGAQFFHAYETQSSGVASTTSGATGSFLTTTLNTTATNEITGASLASNTITLPAGTYYIEAIVPWQATSTSVVQRFQARLFNLTSVATLIYGNACLFFGASNNATLMSMLRGRFTLASLSVLSLQHYKTAGIVGSAASVGSEMYSSVQIWKVA